GLCARSDARLTVTARERRRYRIAVVLAEINHGKPPQRAHVERFMERALVHGPVAEEAQAHLLRLADFGTQSHTGGKRNSPAHDPRLPDETDAVVWKVQP